MKGLTAYNDPTPDLTDAEKQLLRDAGASEELIQVCEFDITEIERDDGKSATRNSILEEAKKYVRGTQSIEASLTDETADDFSQYGGHFFSAIWNGDLYEGYSRADLNNRPMLLELFTLTRINADRPEHRSKIQA